MRTVILDASSMRDAVKRRPLLWRVGYHHAKARRAFSRDVKVWTWRKHLRLWWIAIDLALS